MFSAYVSCNYLFVQVVKEPVQYELTDVVHQAGEICLAVRLDAKLRAEYSCKHAGCDRMEPEGVEIDSLLTRSRLEDSCCFAGHEQGGSLFEAEHGDGMFDRS